MPSEAETRAIRFLHDVMGEEDYNKFMSEGKIDIDSGGYVYQLTKDGKVINKTNNQNYCIVIAPHIPDRYIMPLFDLIAIKYSWLKYGNQKVENVAHRSDLNIINRRRNFPNAGSYDDFVRYMDESGWRRKRTDINENIPNLASVSSIRANTIGSAIEIRCPSRSMITLMGERQNPSIKRDYAHTLTARFTDNKDKELSPETNIGIIKQNHSGSTIRIDEIPYSRVKNNFYIFPVNLALFANQRIEIMLINPDIDITDIKFLLSIDYWNRNCGL